MTMTDPAALSFIPVTAIEALDQRLARINRRAEKLGVEPVRYELTGRTEDREPPKTKRARLVFAGVQVAMTERFVEVAVFGEQPKLPGGWVLLGVVDHREEVPVTKAVPGRELPAGQRDRGPVCDHCGVNRRRVDTFVLQDEDGKVVQVGRQCLADFLGHFTENPEGQLDWWVRVPDLLADLGYGDDDYGFGVGGARVRAMIDVENVVLIAAAMTDEFGWVSKGRARESGEVATAEYVAEILFPPRFTGANDPNYIAWKKLKDAAEARASESLKAEAAAAVEWAKGLSGADNDYLLNLAACANSGKVGADKLGLVASLPTSYRREQERLVERERKANAQASSQHVGEVKKRQEFTVSLLERPRAFEGMYGTKYLHTLLTEDGNVLKWWASGRDLTRDDDVEVGSVFQVKATVKKHGEYNGVAETEVQRVAVVAS